MSDLVNQLDGGNAQLERGSASRVQDFVENQLSGYYPVVFRQNLVLGSLLVKLVSWRD